MPLTGEQEARIARYLRDVAVHLDGALMPEDRQAGLAALESNIRSACKNAVSDEEFAKVLAAYGDAKTQSDTISTAPTLGGRVWLGVCRDWAERFDFPVLFVRFGVVALGITGPIAIAVYLVGYFDLRRRAPKGSQPPIDYARIAKNVLPILVIAIALHVVVGYGIWAIEYLFGTLLKQDLPALGQWDWLESYRGTYFFRVLVCAVPLAVLSGFPLAGGWDYTLKRVAQAMLAVYAIMLSYDFASMLAGIILHFVNDFGGAAAVKKFLSDPIHDVTGG